MYAYILTGYLNAASELGDPLCVVLGKSLKDAARKLAGHFDCSETEWIDAMAGSIPLRFHPSEGTAPVVANAVRAAQVPLPWPDDLMQMVLNRYKKFTLARMPTIG